MSKHHSIPSNFSTSSLRTLLCVVAITALGFALVPYLVGRSEPDNQAAFDQLADSFVSSPEVDFMAFTAEVRNRRLMHLAHLSFCGDRTPLPVPPKPNCVYFYVSFVSSDLREFYGTLLFECEDVAGVFFEDSSGASLKTNDQRKLILMANFHSPWENGDIPLRIERVWVTPWDGDGNIVIQIDDPLQ